MNEVRCVYRVCSVREGENEKERESKNERIKNERAKMSKRSDRKRERARGYPVRRKGTSHRK